ncbi:conserved hypothetical protein [Carnobacterium maltaromaticum]|nr:conserved hypothetical protein [Carnobacterium maltaromaticum]
MLNWDFDFFRKATLNLWLKQYIFYLRVNNPDALKDPTEDKVYTMDQTPFFK